MRGKLVQSSGIETIDYEYNLRDELMQITGSDPDGAGPLEQPVRLFDYLARGFRPAKRRPTAISRRTLMTRPQCDQHHGLAADAL